MLIERLYAFTLLKSVDSGKLFQALVILHAKKRLLAELVLLGLYSPTTCKLQIVKVYVHILYIPNGLMIYHTPHMMRLV